MDQLSLETCKLLKEAGYPQEQWPGYAWDVEYEQLKYYGEQFGSVEFTYDVVTCPPIITADGKGGVLPWLIGRGFEIHAEPNGVWWFWNGDNSTSAFRSPEAIIVACLDRMKINAKPETPAPKARSSP